MIRVLIVDDSSTCRMILMKCLQKLESRKFEFVMAADGQQAWEALHKAYIQLIITDSEMPNLDGFTLVQKIKQVPMLAKTPIVVVSAMSNAKKLEFEKLGIKHVLFKPIEEDKLKACIDELFS